MTEYKKREDYLYGNHIMFEEERKQGELEGIKEGIEKGKIETAKK